MDDDAERGLLEREVAARRLLGRELRTELRDRNSQVEVLHRRLRDVQDAHHQAFAEYHRLRDEELARGIAGWQARVEELEAQLASLPPLLTIGRRLAPEGSLRVAAYDRALGASRALGELVLSSFDLRDAVLDRGRRILGRR